MTTVLTIDTVKRNLKLRLLVLFGDVAIFTQVSEKLLIPYEKAHHITFLTNADGIYAMLLLVVLICAINFVPLSLSFTRYLIKVPQLTISEEDTQPKEMKKENENTRNVR